MRLLWITHRRQAEMSATTLRGVSTALEERGWKIEFISPDGQHSVERSTRMGRGHQTFNRSVTGRLKSMDLTPKSLILTPIFPNFSVLLYFYLTNKNYLGGMPRNNELDDKICQKQKASGPASIQFHPKLMESGNLRGCESGEVKLPSRTY